MVIMVSWMHLDHTDHHHCGRNHQVDNHHHRSIVIIESTVNQDDPAGFSAEIFKYPAGPKTSSSFCFDHLDCHDHNDQNDHNDDLL